MNASHLAAAVRTALERPLGASPGALLHAPRVTALLASAAEAAALETVVPGMLALLERAGTARGVFVCLADARGTDPATWRSLRGRWGVPVMARTSDEAPCFAAGRTSAGLELELDDELREAEALIALASLGREAGVWEPGERVLVPGLVSANVRACIAAEREPRARAELLAAVRALQPLDALLCWHLGDASDARAWFGTPDGVREAIANAPGLTLRESDF